MNISAAEQSGAVLFRDVQKLLLLVVVVGCAILLHNGSTLKGSNAGSKQQPAQDWGADKIATDNRLKSVNWRQIYSASLTLALVGDCALRVRRSAIVGPRTLRATIGDRAFPAAAASVWNSLSVSSDIAITASFSW